MLTSILEMTSNFYKHLVDLGGVLPLSLMVFMLAVVVVHLWTRVDNLENLPSNSDFLPKKKKKKKKTKK